MSRARVLIADDHPIFSEGVRGILAQDHDVVGVVTDGRELVSAARKLDPDLIVSDVTMPSLNGIEAAAQLREAGLRARVIFLTVHREVAYARRAMDAGAYGYVLKHSASEELLTAVRDALRGQTYISPLIAGELLQSYRTGNSGAEDSLSQLTTRQREVLQLYAEGRSAKEVARLLSISIRTAEAHKAHILRTLNLHSTAELVQYAIRNGIITL